MTHRAFTFPPVVRIPTKGLIAGLLLLAGLVLTTGCGVSVVRINTLEADVYVSRTGARPWQQVNDRHKWFRLRDHGGDEPETAARERFLMFRPWWGYGFMRVERDGFIPSETRLVTFSRLGWNVLDFTLQPTRREEARRRMARGEVLFRGEWVNPGEAGLELRDNRWMTAEEAFAFDQEALGLVLLEGEWMTPADRDARLAERGRAAGLEEYKGRFVTPAEAGRMRQIDLQIDELAQRHHAAREAGAASDASTTATIRLEVTGPSQPGVARLKIFNATGASIEALVSGSREVTAVELAAYAESTRTLLPDTYRMAVLPASPGLGDPALLSAELRGGRAHTLVYSGRPAELRNLDEILAADPIDGVNLPAIEIPALPEPEERPRRGRPDGAGGGPGGGERPAGGGGRGAGGGGRPATGP